MNYLMLLERNELSKDMEELQGKIDKYLAENGEELARYGDKETLAFNTVLYDEMEKHESRQQFISNLVVIFCVFGTLVAGLGSLAGSLGSFLTGVGLVGVGLILHRLFVFATVPYFSPVMIKDPEKVKEHFLKDPFGAIEYFVTKSDSSSVLYEMDLEGATMLNDAATAMYRFYVVDKNLLSEEGWRNRIINMAYVKTVYWQRLSKQEKMAYLKNLADEMYI